MIDALETELVPLVAAQQWLHEHQWLPVKVTEKFYDHAVR